MPTTTSIEEGVPGNAALRLPAIDVRHLRTLTDETGILQHARYAVPNRSHGYCVDDNARALIVACWGCGLHAASGTDRLVPVYLAFLNHGFNENSRRFRNFMTYERTWLEDVGSEDAHCWGMGGVGVAAASAPLAGQRALAVRLLEESLPAAERFASPRSWAYALLGIDACLLGNPRAQGLGGSMHVLARMLFERFTAVGDEDWAWCENYLTYDNAVLPWGLLVTAHRMGDEGMKTRALASLEWLIDAQTAPRGHLTLVGNDGWMVRGGGRAQFDQQPLDAASLTLACADAYALTGDSTWREHALRSFAWFTGDNDIATPLVDAETGGCCDGLQERGVNPNCGAESTLAWLLARLRVEMMMRRGMDR